jgi:hypothetical protein
MRMRRERHDADISRRQPKMSLAPWDNSGLRDRLDGSEASDEPRGSVELELCEVARRRDEGRPKRHRLRRGPAAR